MCRRAPLNSARAISRETIFSSAAAGIPHKPRRVAMIPSFIKPPSLNEGSSQWSIIGRPKARLYSIAWRIIRELTAGMPSSLKATAPASASSPISASSLPEEFLVIQPTGSTRTTASLAAVDFT